MEELSKLFSALEAVSASKRQLKQQLDEAEQTIRSLTESIVSEMTDRNVSEFFTSNAVYSISEKLEVKPNTNYTSLADVFYLNSYGNLLTRVIHPSRLQNFVQQSLDNDDQLPDWLQGLVSVEKRKKLRRHHL